ncbi:hypothetical protein A3K34_01620 [candidate division WWE3 bacterium RIFOXYC1_FULL_40_10]|uniref:EF-hand domain-containing protein n=1 Tax=candidate division WWE3 bacterium RIFOXYA2_FULL_46_9 TaxID=1802636 RepID=A0A1F4W2K9_UNCKA|nr:MAG: hypothetical protein A3K58_01620 [candidate division WWE3 bacterium RIFOXYB1_FULL_40_22]OGC61564.1 MAG: hypothetical protein A3K37_01620 [candidate division WWE3 bacterium RIFOXYA1_FULL_40_11]OGC63610.1 MAG: hypothetical protein A2264_04560 [candidate division WWE3 bacterium RIFOXYA2_FULL_46_9]OGC64757.1 MAG: hypothetical protein A2326_01835 [candidate division WWE3 bacterium RIFOXYB2_FULL_41_6]OGC65947.1 MAG: hypothetical protein A3K34_01620 [candidate division WWE3 bacterium RIFOXYC1_
MKKYLLLLLLIVSSLVSNITIDNYSPNYTTIDKVYAEDDEEEDEDEDERERGEDDEDNEVEEWTEVVQLLQAEPDIPEQVVNYITVVDSGYDRDSDKDGLVDALDPNPSILEKELFTDDDGDSVPNALDQKPGEDDFSLVDFEDLNTNGILDNLE